MGEGGEGEAGEEKGQMLHFFQVVVVVDVYFFSLISVGWLILACPE